MNQRELFLAHVAQTSPSPIALQIEKAKGCSLWDTDGKEYLDLIAGISVCNVGHRHPQVVKAIKKQADKYLHLLVYGEMIETPQVLYAKMICDHLPSSLNSVYFTSSGTEATEGAMKLAKRYTGRSEIAAFNKSYHGSSQGALSIIGDEYWRNAYRPLLPGIIHLEYNSEEAISSITTETACVILETVQAERGVVLPEMHWMERLRVRCSETGTLMIFDAIQTGFGRTGTLWGFEQLGVIPDIILLGKAVGGGMPLGAFVANSDVMQSLSLNPVLGHITTFGGHPVCCAAGLAAMKVVLKKSLLSRVKEKERLFQSLLQHSNIIEVRSAGLLIAVEFESFDFNKKVIDYCILHGLLTDWFLFAPECLRIAPPLTISRSEIRRACNIILKGIDFAAQKDIHK